MGEQKGGLEGIAKVLSFQLSSTPSSVEDGRARVVILTVEVCVQCWLVHYDYCRPPSRGGLRVLRLDGILLVHWASERMLVFGSYLQNTCCEVGDGDGDGDYLRLSIGDSMIKPSASGRSATAASPCPSHHIRVYHIRITSQKAARTACGSVCTVPYTGVMFWNASLAGREPFLFGLCPVVRASIQ